MTESELHKNLATIGESFTRIQKQELRSQEREEAALLIGQFGIGLLSAFAVARRVEFFTRSYQPAVLAAVDLRGQHPLQHRVRAQRRHRHRVVLHLLDSRSTCSTRNACAKP